MSRLIDMIRPSGSHEWYYCHGSQLMKQGKPPNDDDRTKEGTACHWVAQEILTAFTTPGSELKSSTDFVGDIAPNGVFIDEEMYQGAKFYVNEILKYCNESGLMRLIHIEELLNTEVIYPSSKGTPDCWVYNVKDAEIVLWDLKYGFSHVEVYENPAMMMYIAGILSALNIDGVADQFLTIRMVIVQPRSFHGHGPVREWKVTASDLRPYFNKLRHAAEQAMNGQGLCTPGLHCRDCLARHDCTALTKTLYNYIDVVTGPVPMALEGQNLVLEWQLLNRVSKLLEYRKSGIDGQIQASLENGDHLAGVKLEKSFGRERWRKDVPTEKVLAMAKVYGADISRPDNLDTPNQTLVKIKRAAKKFNVKIDKSLIEEWLETPFKGYKIVEDDGSEATKVFKYQG